MQSYLLNHHSTFPLWRHRGYCRISSSGIIILLFLDGLSPIQRGGASHCSEPWEESSRGLLDCFEGLGPYHAHTTCGWDHNGVAEGCHCLKVLLLCSLMTLFTSMSGSVQDVACLGQLAKQGVPGHGISPPKARLKRSQLGGERELFPEVCGILQSVQAKGRGKDLDNSCLTCAQHHIHVNLNISDSNIDQWFPNLL